MEEIINKIESQYIIIREKNNKKEYFNGATIYSKDENGILRISNIRWSETFIPTKASYEQSRMKDILNGMKKYKKIEEEYDYVIAEIQTITTIVNYIKC